MKKQAIEIANTAPIAVNGDAAIQNVLQSNTALYFCNDAGTIFRLTNEGVCGWR